MTEGEPTFPNSSKQVPPRNRGADHGPLRRMAFGLSVVVALLAGCSSPPPSNAPAAPAATDAPSSSTPPAASNSDLTGFGATSANFVGGSDIYLEPGMNGNQIINFTINSPSGTTFDQALARAKGLLPADLTVSYDNTQAICRQIVFSSKILANTPFSVGSGMLDSVLMVFESGPSSGLPYDAADISATTLNADPNSAVPGPCL
jgi:hypothetical protein